MPVTIALAGSTILGRGVAAYVERAADPTGLVAGELLARLLAADFFVLSLEGSVADRGEPHGGESSGFRAAPRAAELLARMGVGCVTMANGHTLDYGPDALADTITHLTDVGIGVAGAGHDEASARQPALASVGGLRVGVLGLGDDPPEYAAGPDRPGIAYADLRSGADGWAVEAIRTYRAHVDTLLVMPHWGPPMTENPPAYVRAAARDFAGAGATLVAGDGAGVVHGVEPPVLYDLGGFLNDTTAEAGTCGDLGLVWFVDVSEGRPVRLRALPIALEAAHTRPAVGDEWTAVHRRFTQACLRMGTDVKADGHELVVDLAAHPAAGC
ncbi:CapA family protein [Bailinhaonella thermotolerans]|uniref:CapA family protein n=1 Tax=Bailinhaonella thermotolerans TaxID=1070861 RepID=A0A3A4BRW4_9ACTN|nr:CapA family protein [Bailinhaonella thermotolerans]RJL34066.1 CapA family protein [Bailinhaonella thermotolerans]